MKKLLILALIAFSANLAPAAFAATYTAADVASHSASSDCWTIVSGKVYNITAYVPLHPGGQSAIIGLCGHDGTAAFSGQHAGGSSANNALASYYIGDLVVLDTAAPTIPTNLAAAVISTSQINLSWTASTDNTAVTGYKIFRNGTQIGTSANTSFNNTGLTASTTYAYTVSAVDAAGNASGQTASVSATTLAATPLPAPNVNPKWQKFYDKKISKLASEHNKAINRLKKNMTKAISKTTDSAKIKKITDQYNAAINRETAKYNKKIAQLNKQLQNKLAKINGWSQKDRHGDDQDDD